MKARRKRRKRKRKKSPSNNNSNKLSRNSTCTPNPLKPIKINPKPKSGKPSFKSIKTDSTTKSNSKDTSRTGNKTYPKKILNSTEDNKNYKNTSEKWWKRVCFRQESRSTSQSTKNSTCKDHKTGRSSSCPPKNTNNTKCNTKQSATPTISTLFSISPRPIHNTWIVCMEWGSFWDCRATTEMLMD